MDATKVVVSLLQTDRFSPLEERLHNAGFQSIQLISMSSDSSLGGERPGIALLEADPRDPRATEVQSFRIGSFYKIPVFVLHDNLPSDQLPIHSLEIAGFFTFDLDPAQFRIAALHALSREQAYREMREKEIRLESVLDFAGTGLIAVDETGRITMVNRYASSLTGHSTEECRGAELSAVFTLINEKTRETKSFPAEKTLRSGETVQYRSNALLVAGDGREIPVEYGIFPIHISQNTISGAVISFHDITLRKRVQKRFRHTYRELAQIKYALDMHSIVAITDTRGIITYVNDKFCEISKYTRSELIGKTHRIVKSDFYPPAFFEDMWKTITAGKVWKGEIQNRAKDGIPYWVDTTIVPLFDDRGKPEKYIAIRTDITDRKRYVERLKVARDQAEAANRAKSEFLANVSHELRTPLNSIIGFSRLLKMAPTEEEEKEFLEYILSSATHLLRLINDILDLSKIESGRMHFDRKPMDFSRALTETTAMVLAEARKKGIEIRQEAPVGKDHLILGDEKRIRQALLNLLSNAVKFTPNGGEIILRMKATDRLLFSVQDTGIGIKPEHFEFIFEKFTQVDSTATRESEGTGLGLAITRRIIEAHGGNIHVASEEGRGTTFTLELPLYKPSESQEPAAKRPIALPYPDFIRNKILLIVDDDDASRSMLSTYFSLIGQKFQTARGGWEALEILATQTIDGVFMDIKMPGMNGVEAMQHIKKMYPLPVIALTAGSEFGEERELLEKGFDAFIPKPVDFDILSEVLKKVFPHTGHSI